MHTNKRFLPVMLALMVFSACENAHKDIDITLQTNHSELVAAIENMDKSLSEKLQLIQNAVSGGFADQAAAQELLRQAVESLSGTLEEKLSALEAAVQNKSVTLELKLGLIETAINEGFADAKAQQALLQSTLSSLGGTLEEKLSAVETSLKNQTLSLETKLALIETALQENLSDGAFGQEMMVTALETLSGTLEERLKAIETAVGSQVSGLSAKLGLIEAALDKELADNANALALVRKAVEALEGTAAEKLSAVETAVKSQTASLEAKLGLIEAAAKVGFASSVEQQKLLNEAVAALNDTAENQLSAIQEAIGSQGTTLSSKLALIETAIRNGLATREQKQGLIRQALAALEGTLDEKLAAVDTAMLRQTDSLTTKLGVIVEELEEGMADEAKALGQLGTAITALAATLDDPQAAHSVAAAIDSISTRLSAEGAVGKTLSDLVVAVQGLNYTEALTMLAQALEDLAAMMQPIINGHEYVDLGLSVKWATCNVGATKPEEYGGYFAWGETAEKSKYDWNTYFDTQDGGNTFEEYFVDKTGAGRVDLGPGDDAATANWGSPWRMPTNEEWKELVDNCNTVWTTQNEVKGLLLTSNKNGATLFLPAAGLRYDEKTESAGVEGIYWSSTLYYNDVSYAWLTFVVDTKIERFGNYRYVGLSIRPVSE